MSVRVNVDMFKFMCTPIKLGVRMNATYTNFRTLPLLPPPPPLGIGLKRHIFKNKHYLHKSYLHKTI